jgi:hypothetical protein
MTKRRHRMRLLATRGDAEVLAWVLDKPVPEPDSAITNEEIGRVERFDFGEVDSSRLIVDRGGSWGGTGRLIFPRGIVHVIWGEVTFTVMRVEPAEDDETSNVYTPEPLTSEIVEMYAHPRTCFCPQCSSYDEGE